MISRSLWRSSPALVCDDQITPLEMITRSEEMSQRSGSASSASRIGLANASPTIDRLFTRSRSTVSSSSTASKCRPTVVTIEPASASVHIALNAPVMSSAPPKRNEESVNAYWRSTTSTAGRSPGSMRAWP